jgi:hypothetical protein
MLALSYSRVLSDKGATMRWTRGGLILSCICLLSAVAEAQCAGDADGDGRVTVDEIVTTVNFALGGCPGPPEECLGDVNGDRQVTVDEIVTVVNNALRGCDPTPTPSPTTRIIDFGTPTHTATPTGSETPTPSSSATPTASNSATPTPSSSATPTPSISPTATPSSSATPTLSPTARVTPSSALIDFGAAGGVVGFDTQLPFVLSKEMTVSRMSFTVQYDSSAFVLDDCSGPDLEVETVAVGNELQIEVVAEPPVLLFAGQFMSCFFDVAGHSGVYPVSLSGTIVDDDGNEVPVVADGQFTINPQCMIDDDCFDRICVDERCVDAP